MTINCSKVLTVVAFEDGKESTNVTAPMATAPVASCLLPQYQMYTWVLAMVCLASFLKLNYMIKSAILLVMVIVYTSLMVAAYPTIFDEVQVRFNHFFFIIESSSFFFS